MLSLNVWIIPVAVSLLCGTCCSTPGELGDYCFDEEFRANCGPDHVVVMTTATYGRMHVGRCIKGDYGYIGCQSNVIGIVDQHCSGRRSCEIRIPNIQIHRATNCHRDLHAFLLAEYRCIEVVNHRTTPCNLQQTLPLRQKTGTIANVVTMETGCGGPQSPWLIEGWLGQGINVTLLDFSQGIDNTTCHDYARLTEMDGRTTEVCLGYGRERHIYTTDSHRLQVVIRAHKDLPEQAMFLIKYTVFGCPDIEPTPEMWVNRVGHSVTCGCKTSNLRWKLYCHDDTWVGETFSCTTSATTKSPPAIWSNATETDEGSSLVDPTVMLLAICGTVLFFL